eukprot:7382173-Prymnesium_polylepis.1
MESASEARYMHECAHWIQIEGVRFFFSQRSEKSGHRRRTQERHSGPDRDERSLVASVMRTQLQTRQQRVPPILGAAHLFVPDLKARVMLSTDGA